MKMLVLMLALLTSALAAGCYSEPEPPPNPLLIQARVNSSLQSAE
jgi:hypothetical protein